MSYFERDMPIDYPPALVSKRPRVWPAITPYLHERIKRLYLYKRGCSGAVREFSESVGMPRWKISRYALEQGWTSKQPKEPNWSETELAVMERNAHHCPGVIQRKLKAAGFQRSVVGIVLKRRRMRMLQNLEGMSATQLALCLGEDIHFVTRNIRLGELKAQRRQTERTPQQGGDTYLIREKHIREFILNNLNTIDLRKVDKYWFVDLLTNGGILQSRESEAA
jgi:hypothetical protein